MPWPVDDFYVMYTESGHNNIIRGLKGRFREPDLKECLIRPSCQTPIDVLEGCTDKHLTVWSHGQLCSHFSKNCNSEVG